MGFKRNNGEQGAIPAIYSQEPLLVESSFEFDALTREPMN